MKTFSDNFVEQPERLKYMDDRELANLSAAPKDPFLQVGDVRRITRKRDFYSLRSLLLFNILLQHSDWSASDASCEVRRRPQNALVKEPVKSSILLRHAPGGNTLQAIDQFGDTDFWGICNEKMYMVIFSIKFFQLHLEVITDLVKHIFQKSKVLIVKNLSSILRHKHQVTMHRIDNVPSCTNLHGPTS